MLSSGESTTFFGRQANDVRPKRVNQVVIDATNLHVGGGVQVASAFLQDVLEQQRDAMYLYPWVRSAHLLVSAEVLANLPSHLAEGVIVSNSHEPTRGTPDLRFFVFGPRYRETAARRTLAGFADVTSIYPSPLTQPIHLRAKTDLRGRLSRRFFKSVDHIVVETGAVRDRLTRYGFNRSRITVVPNTYHPVFNRSLDSKDTLPPGDPGRPAPQLLYVARAYPHKNHDFLGDVAHEYRRLTGDCISTKVTLTDAEWSRRTPSFKRSAINLGPVHVHQLPQLYRNADIVIFPSLLECFSVTPLEAMAMGRPIVASDRDFVRTICGGAASYFDPMDPKSAADAIFRVAHDDQHRDGMLAIASQTIRSWPNSAQRTNSYLELIDRILRT